MTTSLEVLAVSVAPVGALWAQVRGRPERLVSAIAKRPLSTLQDPQRVVIGPLGAQGDEHADPTVHGGLDKALYLYPEEHLDFWKTVSQQAHSGFTPGPGSLGDNVLVRGLTEVDVFIGDLLVATDLTLRIESPRSPCHKFNAHLGFEWASKMMLQSGYTGFYCSVVRPGSLRAGDRFEHRRGEGTLSIVQAHRLRHRTLLEPPR